MIAPQVALPAVIAVLAVANVLNNRLAPRAYVVTSLVTSAGLLLLLRLAGVPWAAAGLGRDTLRRGLLWGLVLVIVVAVGYLVLALLPATRDYLEDRRIEGAGWGGVAYQALLRVPLGTVLLEEVAFRGVLYALARGQYGTGWGTVLSSLLFGLWHILPSTQLRAANPAVGRLFGGRLAAGAVPIPLAAVIVTAAAGAALCGLRLLSDSLLAPMAVHWATNGFGYLMAHLVIRRRRL